MNYKIALCLVMIFSANFLMAAISEKQVSIIENLIMNQHLSDNQIDQEYLESCQRLNIRYSDACDKCLFGFESFSEFKTDLLGKSLAFQTIQIDSVFSKIIITNQSKDSKTIFLKKDRLISSAFYYRQISQTYECQYYKYYFSDSTRFNQFASNYLDNETDKFLKNVGLNKDSMKVNLLKTKKINYIICKDMDEMECITGFRTNGIALLNEDTIVSIDPAHFHEAIHILINFVTEKPFLYTHPLFQEGLAVALGGRSGRSAETMIEAGKFLTDAGFICVSDLFNIQDFNQTDPSISYPVSAYVVTAELSEGYDHFLKLYRKYSGNAQQINQMIINQNDLINQNKRDSLTSKYNAPFNTKNINKKQLSKKENWTISEISNNNSNDYCYSLIIKKGIYLFEIDKRINGFKSRIFAENLPNTNYKQQRYLLKVDENECILYDLFLEKIIYMISNGFSDQPLIIEQKNNTISLNTNYELLIKLLK